MSKWNDQQSRRLVTTSHLPIQGNWDIFLFVTSSLPTLLVKEYAFINSIFSPFTVRSPRRNFYGTLTSFTKVKDACISSPVRALCSSLKASKVAKKSRSASSIVAPSPKNPKGNCSLQYTLYHPAPLLSTCASYSFIK